MATFSRWLLNIFIFSIPWENVIVVPGIGTVTRILGVLTVATFLLYVASRQRIRTLRIEFIGPLLFVVWASGSLLWTISVDQTASRMMTFAQLAMMFVLMWQMSSSEQAREMMLRAYVLGCYGAAGATFYNAMTGASVTPEVRYAAAGFDPNDLGVTLALGIPIAWHVADRATWHWRVIFRAYILVAAVAIAMTASRGAFLTSVVAMLGPLFSMRHSRMMNRIAAAVLAGMLILLVATFVPEAALQRIASTGDELRSGTLTHRTLIWQAGLRAFQERPLLGYGSGTYAVAAGEVVGRNWVAHNTFISVLVELGIVGLMIWLLSLTIYAWGIRRLSGGMRTTAYVLLCSWIVGVSSLSWEHRKPTWFVLGILASAVATTRYSTRLRVVAQDGGKGAATQVTVRV